VFTAGDFADAFQVAIGRAESDQESYLNSTGDTVRRLLVRIETLDWLGSEISDGREVYSEPGPTVPISAGELSYHPLRFEPTQTGV